MEIKIDRERLLNNFLKYVSVNTQSKMDEVESPTTSGQVELARFLKKELDKLGLKEIVLTKHCYLTATLESN